MNYADRHIFAKTISEVVRASPTPMTKAQIRQAMYHSGHFPTTDTFIAGGKWAVKLGWISHSTEGRYSPGPVDPNPPQPPNRK